tara:strand:- start:317 stop:1111 length:795 start_codon:yes stop_codon:yes gene_type:complete
MTIFESIILGLVQGLTEFLPISSSGHIEIGKVLMNINLNNEKGLFLSLTLHLATAISTVVVYRKTLFKIISDLFEFKKNNGFKLSIKIIISMIPAVLIALFYEKEISKLFNQNIILVGLMLIITSILLFLGDRNNKNKSDISYKNSILIGIIQAIAILPGISRSGSTISYAVLIGTKRIKAAEFSFLMVLPLIFGSMLKSLFEIESYTSNIEILPLMTGFISALITGIFACKWMIILVKKSKLKYFGYYCFLLGFFSISYGLFI